MKCKILLLLVAACASVQAESNDISLVRNKKSDYKIILSKDSASHWDSLASAELQRYLQEIAGVQIPVISDLSPVSDNEIVLGQNSHSKDLDISSVKNEDGYLIKTEGRKIFFTGGKERGTLNAVYSFLEKYLGCRMYSAKVKVIPKKSSITLPQINYSENPVFTYRDIHYTENADDAYALWHKLTRTEDKKNTWGMYVHTFNTLLPAEKYFKDHPEYFAMRNGIRTYEQPCLSNPEVLRIMIEELRKRINENPEAKIWSVSQNDNFSCCQCPECSKLDSIEGSPSGSVINFVNKIAREFPDKIISTLAYQYSRKAPKTIKPEKNVNIMLCTIECYRTKPLETDSSEGSFTRDLIEWSSLTDNIMVWDYVVQFTNLISPFPNFQVLQPNIKLFAKYNAKMMFQQGAGPYNKRTEFEELRCYLISKLLWNPNANIDSVMNDFLTGYYGNAGQYIRKYVDLMKDELIKSGAKLWIYASPVESMKDYLSPELMEKYERLFDQAEKAVKGKPELLARVKMARLPLKYARLEQAKVIEKGNYSLYTRNESGSFKVNPRIASLLDEFYRENKPADDTYVNESHLSVETYVNRYRSMLSKGLKNSLALNKPVRYITQPSEKYPARSTLTLTDGLHGDEDHHFNWQGFEGEDMEIVLDLQKPETVKKVSMDFLQSVFSWIFLPEELDLSASDDGNSFRNISTLKNDTPADSTLKLHSGDQIIKNFTITFEPVRTRYLKLKAVSLKTCPRWHPGYPFKAWIFTDEIVVE